MLRKFKVNVDGNEYLVELEEIGGSPQAPVAVEAQVSKQEQPKEPVKQEPVKVASEGITIEAPMPGNILKVMVNVGDSVSFEQPLVVLEAMKMENEIVSPKAGKVEAIYVTENSPIDVGKPIVTIV